MKLLTPLAVIVLGLTLATIAFRPVHAENRTWTQASSGRTIEGEFVKVEGDNVHIKSADGGIVPVPLAMLSAEDQAFISAQAKAADPTENTPAADTEAKPVKVALHEVHLCCSACGRRVEEAVAEIAGVSVDIDRDEGIVTMDAPSSKVAQEAIDAIAAAGFYGKSDSHDIDFKSPSVQGGKVKSVTITGVHLCCKGCVTAVEKALASVDGVEANTAENKAESFEITGDFLPSDVLRSLRKAGMNGVIAGGAEAATE